MINWDGLIAFVIVIIIFLVIYSRYNHQPIIQTLKDIKEAIKEIKGSKVEDGKL
jgi:hypothetical protein